MPLDWAALQSSLAAAFLSYLEILLALTSENIQNLFTFHHDAPGPHEALDSPSTQAVGRHLAVHLHRGGMFHHEMTGSGLSLHPLGELVDQHSTPLLYPLFIPSFLAGPPVPTLVSYGLVSSSSWIILRDHVTSPIALTLSPSPTPPKCYSPQGSPGPHCLPYPNDSPLPPWPPCCPCTLQTHSALGALHLLCQPPGMSFP